MVYFKLIAENRRARYNFEILDTVEAGIVLKGNEVKSVRLGQCQIKDSFARFEKRGLYLLKAHISPYEHAGSFQTDPVRSRKLLLKKNQLKRLIGSVQQKGLTLIPLKVYFKGNWAKVELGLAKAKRKYDKRQKIKDREIKRRMERIKL